MDAECAALRRGRILPQKLSVPLMAPFVSPFLTSVTSTFTPSVATLIPVILNVYVNSPLVMSKLRRYAASKSFAESTDTAPSTVALSPRLLSQSACAAVRVWVAPASAISSFSAKPIATTAQVPNSEVKNVSPAKQIDETPFATAASGKELGRELHSHNVAGRSIVWSESVVADRRLAVLAV